MSKRRITLPLPGREPAQLLLPDTLTPPAVGSLESALADALRTLRDELAPGASDPGAVEYDSWQRAPRPARSLHS
jgi:hypothetical protein